MMILTINTHRTHMYILSSGGLSLSLQLLHGRLVLGVHGGQLLPDAVMDLHELGHATVHTYGLALAEVSLVIFWRDTLLVTCSGQSVGA